MNVFVDTTAFYAYINSLDSCHQLVVPVFQHALDQSDSLVSSNYVALETNALVQRRLGMSAVRTLERDVFPQIKLVWVEQTAHQTALGLLLSANRRKLSLVDCTSFEIMRREAIHAAITLDRHFADQGFDVLPARGE